jgi:lambda family phage portal protein
MNIIASILPFIQKRLASMTSTGKYRQRWQRRSFAGAQINRLTKDFDSSLEDIQTAIRSGGLTLIARARDLSQNNAVAKRLLQLYVTNVIGYKGHTFQPNVSESVLERDQKGKEKIVSKPDVLANAKILEAWEDWIKPEFCSVDGRLSFAALSKLAGIHKARDGEAFIRKIINPNAKHPLQLQLIPPEAIDFTYNKRLDNGNVIIMGIELDASRKPVAYHMNVVKPEAEVYGALWQYSRKRDRIPAEEIIHWFDQEYFNQTRGITKFAQIMMLLHDLNRYEYAVLVNATVSAAKMGFFGDAEGESEPLTGDSKNEDDETVIEAEAGTFTDIGSKKFFPWEPQFPTQQYEMYVRSLLRKAASGWGLAYSSLANDYGEANYSSLRAELLVERENWKTEQQSFIDQVLKPIFSKWLELELLAGNIKLPILKIDKFNNPTFVGPRWPWVDPVKDVEAKKAEVAALFESPFGVIAEKGESSLEQIYQDNAEAKDLAEKYGLKADYGSKVESGSQSDQPAMPKPATSPDGEIAAQNKQADEQNQLRREIENERRAIGELQLQITELRKDTERQLDLLKTIKGNEMNITVPKSPMDPQDLDPIIRAIEETLAKPRKKELHAKRDETGRIIFPVEITETVLESSNGQEEMT